MTTDAAAVKLITGSTLPDATIDAFIAAALCLIDAASECAGVSQACEDQAHTFLSAHLLVTSGIGKSSAPIKSESIEDVYKVAYAAAEVKGEGLISTHYGATANALMNGCLIESDMQNAQLFSIGSC